MIKIKVGIMGGLGHIGLIQAACLAKLGYQVTAYDINQERLQGVREGKMPFYEPGLEELVKEATNNGLLEFTSDIKNLENAEIIFICVGTPSLSTGEADLSQVYSAVLNVAQNRDKQCVVAIKSTVPVGTSRGITKYLDSQGLKEKVTMVSNPEFLKEGAGVQDFWEPSRIVVGGQVAEARDIVANLYAPPGVPVIKTSWENSELIKYASNTFLATKISFINEIAQFCEKIGGDIKIISQGIGLDPRINPHFIEAGVGFSGPCLEKDLKSLISQFKQLEQRANILEAVFQVNEAQRQGLVKKLENQLGTLDGKNIGVLGMVFKAGTDDVRDSHSLPILKQLLALGAKITVTDSSVKSFQQGGISPEDFPGVHWVSSPYEAAQDKDGLLILAAWPEYKKLDFKKIKDLMKKDLIVDGRNLFNPKEMEAIGINYWGVGR